MSPSLLNNEELHSRFELRTLLETSRLLIESRDMDFVLNNLLLITMGKLMVTKGMVIMYQPADDTYVVSKSKGSSSPEEGSVVPIDWDASTRQQAVIQCGRDGIEMPGLFEADNRCTFFNLRTSNRHIGYLCLGSKGNKQPLSLHEIEFVEGLSIISSVAIANSRMFAELRRINRMLDRKVYELHSLFDLSKDFNGMTDREEIIRVFKFTMLGQMLIRTFFFVLQHDGEREVVAASGINRMLEKEEIDELFELEDDLVEVGRDLSGKVPFLSDQEIKAVIGLKFQNKKIGLVGFGARANREEYSPSDYSFLRSLGNLALLSIQKTYLFEEQIEKERLEEELTIAKSIQQGLLPDPVPGSEELDIAATNISSHQMGGDYFDILETPQKNLLFAIADVSGKGTPAALLMANLQAMLHVLLPVEISLSEASGRINDIIYQNTPSDKFITFFWGIFCPRKYTFKFVNAGHNPPILLKKESEETEKLKEGGLILGAVPTTDSYLEKEVDLSPGDLLVFYTDGVTEALNPEGTEEYEEERLAMCLKRHRNASARKIMEAILEDVNNFSDHVQQDDITLIVIKVN